MQNPPTENSQQPGITVELVGGLGNQLFIYATGYEMSLRLDCPLYVDTTWFRAQSDRNLGLNSFTNDAIFISSRPFIRRAKIKLHKIMGPLLPTGTKVFVESQMDYLPEVSKLPLGSTLRGYFQSWKYFEEHAKKIRSQIHDLVNPSDWYQTSHVEFQDQEEWVAVHVRRGDYLNSGTRGVHGILGNSYYTNAIKQIDAHFGHEVPLKVFSDDHSAAKVLFQESERRIEFVEEHPNSNPIESMLLMSQGSGIIAANSSFSWWAAWLGDSTPRPVIVPNPWFQSKSFNQEDLFLQHWTSLKGDLG
jgi:hypothetical protein